MENFIYTKENCLNKELCNKIIEYFEKNIAIKSKTKSKNCNTMFFSLNSNKLEFEAKIIKLLKSEIDNYVNLYGRFIAGYNKKEVYANNFFIKKIQKNTKNGYIPHSLSGDNKLITFVFYLNTVDQEKHDILVDNINIDPKEGMLLLFPSDWTFPYQLNSSLNDDKYILKGEIVCV